MPSQALPSAESLRTPESISEPDPRTKLFWGQNPLSLAAHHAEISAIQLSTAVPEPIAIQFETARNLYLYAWHVYRFYMVASTQALTTLEFGLREKLPDRLPEPYQRKKQKQAMLAGMLSYAIDNDLIRNEGFRRWHQAAAQRARERRSKENLRIMLDLQLESMDIDESDPLVITPEDQRWDLVNVLRDSLPDVRNELAHGSSMLTRNVLGTIELVAEILCQLYPESPQKR